MPATCFWDKLPATLSARDMSSGMDRGAVTSVRQMRRTDPFEEATYGLSDASLARSSEWLDGPLREVLSDRVSYWRTYRGLQGRVGRCLANVLAAMASLVTWGARGYVRGGGIVSFVVAAALLLLLGPIAGFAIVLVIMLMGELARRTSTPRVARALLRGRCGDCGYQLLQPEEIREDICHYHPGPRRCPECGVAWPLVPPPAPGEGAPPYELARARLTANALQGPSIA